MTLTPPFSRLVALLATALCALTFACGSETDGGGSDGAPSTPQTDALRAQLDAAGDNVKSIHDTWTAIQAKLAAPNDEKASLEGLAQATRGRFVSSLESLVSKSGAAGDLPTLEKISGWAEQALSAEKARAGDSLAGPLETQLRSLWQYQLAKDHESVSLREKLGYRAIELDFDKVLEEPYLDTNEVKELEKLRRELGNKGEEAGGKIWLKPGVTGLADIDEVLARLEKSRLDFEERMKDPWEQEALRTFNEVVKDLDEALNSSYTWVPRTFKPYLLIVEKDRSWNETSVAASRAEALLQLYDVFYNQYGKDLNLRPVEKPVPVVFFRRDGYRQYALSRNLVGAAGHFEPGSGRLFTSNETDIGTIFHEGTHQLSFFNTSNVSFLEKSYWFEEGLAEFLAGNTRDVNKETGGWDYTVGLLQIGRLNFWRQNEAKAYSLWDLMNLKYRDRQINIANSDEEKNLMVYSQGWFLCYFMNWFRADGENVVQLGVPGKYRDAWMDFFAKSLKGIDSRDDLLKSLGMDGANEDDPRFKAFEREFKAYYEWVNRKIAMKQVKDNKFIPWSEFKNKRGDLVGEKEEDTLRYED
ncbi:MAG: DUF1570 domain-containing protein [Planctomycetota bacterium]